MVAITTPIATGARTLRPNAMRTPAAMPEAGQNTATPSSSVRR